MSEPKFTPGEWTVLRAKAPTDDEYDYAIMAHGTCIAEAFGRVGETVTAPAYQNAHLIAASPEMYTALSGLVEEHIKRGGAFDEPCASSEQTPEINAACAALAKARGGAS